MFRKFLSVTLLACMMTCFGSANTSSITSATGQKTRIIKVRILPDDGTLKQCVNQSIPSERRLERHDAILEEYQGRQFVDTLSILEAEIGRLEIVDYRDRKGTMYMGGLRRYHVYEAVTLARALEACSKTYEIEVPVDLTVKWLGDDPSEGRFIAIAKKDLSTYILEIKS